jgi:hypothetical protein
MDASTNSVSATAESIAVIVPSLYVRLKAVVRQDKYLVPATHLGAIQPVLSAVLIRKSTAPLTLAVVAERNGAAMLALTAVPMKIIAVIRTKFVAASGVS